MGKVNATVDSTWDDAKDLAGDGAEKLKELTEKEKGADWDKNYIESQVDIHQRVLDKLTDAAKSNTDTTITAALTKATAKVQAHLTKAQSIKAGLHVTPDASLDWGRASDRPSGAKRNGRAIWPARFVFSSLALRSRCPSARDRATSSSRRGRTGTPSLRRRASAAAAGRGPAPWPGSPGCDPPCST